MAISSKLRVMISSRCDDFFPTGQIKTRLSDIRGDIKRDLEAASFLGKPLFEVWINELTAPQEGTLDSWEVCLKAVEDCDIIIVLSNGNAGWSKSAGDVGICHAELMTALSTAPAKVRLIALGNVPISNDDAGSRNKRFQDYVSDRSLFRGGIVKTHDALRTRVKEAVRDAVLKLTQAGVHEASRGKAYDGAALNWSRLDFDAREKEMVRVLREAMLAQQGSTEAEGKVIVKIGGYEVLCHPHAIPAALTVSAAREKVGQPFLHDYLLAPSLKGSRGGPIHVIACSKTATESQASKLLGFPDATIVSAPFGVFVADPIQKVQFAFITNCLDDASTRHGLQRFFEWLHQTGEDVLLAKRAKSRASIVRAIAKEVIV